MLRHDIHMAGLVPDWFLLNTTVDCGEDLGKPGSPDKCSEVHAHCVTGLRHIPHPLPKGTAPPNV